MAEPYPILYWIISCFDKRREKPFPVYNRCFVLDWSRLSSVEATEVLQIIAHTNSRHRYSPAGFDTAVITMSRSPTTPDWRILKFRPHFNEISDEEFARLFEEPGKTRVEQVHLDAEYFEDETGCAITEYEMIQHVSGEETPIIVGNANSVTRLGPTTPTATANWTFSSANRIAQFIEVVERIASSAWFRTPKTVTFETTTSSDGPASGPGERLLEAVFPNDEETTAVLAYFRQLHAKDKLLVKAVECYVEHCSDARKIWWVEERKAAFSRIVDRPPFLEDTKTRREILQMFMYGAGLLHSKSDFGDDVALVDFIAKHGRERALVIFNNCLMDFLGVAVSIYHVIKQDFEHWLTAHSLASPNRQQIAQLFRSFAGEMQLPSIGRTQITRIDGGHERIVRRRCEVFDKPKRKSTKIGELKPGTVGTVTDRAGKWRRIESRDTAENEKSGWVRSKYLAKDLKRRSR